MAAPHQAQGWPLLMTPFVLQTRSVAEVGPDFQAGRRLARVSPEMERIASFIRTEGGCKRPVAMRSSGSVTPAQEIWFRVTGLRTAALNASRCSLTPPSGIFANALPSTIQSCFATLVRKRLCTLVQTLFDSEPMTG